MIRIRKKNSQIETGSGKESFCSFNIYWRNSIDDLLHPDERCIDVMVQGILKTFNYTSTPGKLYSNDIPRTLESFHGFLKDNGFQRCSKYRLFYRDDENDDIPIDSDLEYEEALKFLLSRHKETKEDVIMIIEGDIKKASKKLSKQLKTSLPNASAIDTTTDDSKECSKLQKETAPIHEMNSSDDMKNVTSDSLKNEEVFDMLRTYLEDFKKEIVNDVVKIIEKKLLSAFGNEQNNNVELDQESPIYATLNQENTRNNDFVMRLRRMMNSDDELRRQKRLMSEERNIHPLSFPGRFPRAPIFPIPRQQYMHPSTPPILPQFPPSNDFTQFMNTNDFENYISLLAQGAASAQVASDMFAKCNNNPRKNDTEPQTQKETDADDTEAHEVFEDMNEGSSDSSSFEILSTISSPTYMDDDNPKLLNMRYKPVVVYDCSSDEEHNGTPRDSTLASSSDTAGEQKPKDKIVPELDKRSGGAYSYVNGSLLSTSSNGMTATDSLVDNNNCEKDSSNNTKPTESSNTEKKPTSTNRHNVHHVRPTRLKSRIHDHRYTEFSTDEKPQMNNDSSQNKRDNLMNSYYNLLHNERDYRRQYFQPAPPPNQYSNRDDEQFRNFMLREEYSMGYDECNSFRHSNESHNGSIDPSMFQPVLRGAYDAAQKALSVAHEVIEKTSKFQGPRM